ncbi:MAG: hypothetical protein PF551_06410 [Candidatus Marinimicrobia bacterium]|jgi:hypothetical protein|nr:hypothetical protein [Candidatus Neomarinimicrobiota bacterium]
MDLIRNENKNGKYLYLLVGFLLIISLISISLSNPQTNILNINNKDEVKDLLAAVDLIGYDTKITETEVNFHLNYLSKLDLYFPVLETNINLLDNYSINTGFGITDFYGNSLEYYLISANYKKVIKDSSNYNISVSLNKRIINNVNFKNRVVALRVLIERKFGKMMIGGGAECGIENGRFSNNNIAYNLKEDEDIKFVPILYIKLGFLNLMGEYCRGHFGIGIDVTIKL